MTLGKWNRHKCLSTGINERAMVMNAKRGLGIAVVLVATGSTFWQLSVVSAAAQTSAVTAATAVPSVLLAGDEGDVSYVGNKSCKKCHFKQNKSWGDTPHAKAFDILLPGNSAEAKTAHGLDPSKDYSTDEKCVKCHVVGLGHEGGYKIGGDEKEMKDLVGVGCESCHGAGGKYVEFHEQIMKEKKNYKVDEMYAVGMTKVDVDTCKKCHNAESPTFDDSKPFDFDEMVKKGAHENQELKYRQE